eukprot:2866635-Karenia_brevis.AAC.1
MQDGSGASGNRVFLDEKDFRRVDTFEGEVEKHKSWFFDFFVAVGKVGAALANDVKLVLARKKGIKNPEKWTPM